MKNKKCLKCGKIRKANPNNKYCRKCYNFIRNNKDVLYQNKEWLEYQYSKGLSFNSISKLANCGHTSIAYWFKKFGLKSRPAPCSGVCQRELNYSWKGGVINANGYVYIHHEKFHLRKTRKYYVPEQILVMEKIIGRRLNETECVHHKNGIRNDNRPENLQLFPDMSSHKKYEAKIELFAKQLLFGDICSGIKPKLLNLLNTFLSKNE